MSRKHGDRSLALHPDRATRRVLRAAAGPRGSIADAARRRIEAALAQADRADLADPPGPAPGRPLRVQLPRGTLAALHRAAAGRSLSPEALALALLADPA